MKKQCLSWGLILSLLLTMLPVPAMAAEQQEPEAQPAQTAYTLSQDTEVHSANMLTSTGMGTGTPSCGGTHTDWTPLSGTINSNSFSSGSYCLSGETVTASDLITIEGDVTLCLNGKTLNLNQHNITVDGGSLTICDCSDHGSGGSGKITGGQADQGGAVLVNNGGSLILHSGTITGNEARDSGGVRVNGGTFTMSGGAITSNKTTDGGGAGVLLYSGTFEMTGGSITKNTAPATASGGGVLVSGSGSIFTMSGNASITGNTAGNGGGVLMYRSGTFTMNGGSITNNKASSSGGGVYSSGTFMMNGGSITNNNASNRGGGVYSSGTFSMSGSAQITGNTSTSDLYLYGGGGVFVSSGTFTLSGAPTITGNTKNNADNNVHLNSNTVITIGGQLTDGSKIGVTMKTPGVFTSGWANVNGSSQFTSDDSNYDIITQDGSGELMLHKHNYTYTVSSDKTTITETCTCGHSATATLSAPRNLVYDGQPKEANIEYEGSWAGETPAITYQEEGTPIYAAPTDAGTYTATIQKDSATASITFIIKPKAYSEGDFTIKPISQQDYTGSEIEPDVTITVGGKTLEKGTDYTLTYEDNTNKGTATVTITFQGNYSGTVDKTFEIDYADLSGGISNETVFVDYDTTSDWSNSEDGVTFETQDGWTVSTTPGRGYGNSVNFTEEGTHTKTVYVKDSSGNIYETEITYKLDKTNPTVSGLTAETSSWTAEDITVSFTASDATAGIAGVTVTGPDGSDPTATPGSNGKYTFEATENGEYIVTVTDNADNVTTKKITISNIDKTEPSLTISGGDTGDTNLTLTIEASDGEQSGVAHITVSGPGSPTVADNNTFTVTQSGTYTVTVTDTAGNEAIKTVTVHSVTIDGTVQLVKDGGTATAPAAPEKPGYTFDGWYQDDTKWDFNTKVTGDLILTGRWTLQPPTVALNDNGTTDAEYNDGKTVITLTAAPSHTAGAGITYTYQWYKDGEEVPGSTSDTLNLSKVEQSGRYTVKVTATDGEGRTAEKTSEPITVNIHKKSAVTQWPTASAITYGQSLAESTLTGGQAADGAFSWENNTITPRVADSGTTEYTVVFKPADTANYAVETHAITLTVHPKTVTPASATADGKIYDGNADTTGTISLTGAEPGDEVTATGDFAFADANAGNGKIVHITNMTLTGRDAGNYRLSDATELTATADIEKKTVGLTWNGGAELVYDGTPAGITATAVGLVADDTCQVIVTGGDHINASDAPYTATATSLSNDNYALPGSDTSFTYTIAPRPVELQWSASSTSYDGTEKTVTAEVVNKCREEDAFTLEYTGNTATNVGSAYEASVTGLGNPNYTLAGGSGVTHTWSIAPKSITGTWQGIHQVYGDDSAASILLDGLVSGDSHAEIRYYYTGTTANGTPYEDTEPPEQAGTYTVTAAIDNYKITNASATLEILKKPVVITVTDNVTTTDNVSLPTISAPPDLDDVDYEVLYKDEDGKVVSTPTEPGSYEVWVKFPDDSNYRHPDGSSEAPVGSFTIAETLPTLYAVTFVGGEGVTGTMDPLNAVGGAILTLPECDFDKADARFTGWSYGGKTYQPGDRFTMPSQAVTFTAQWQQTYGITVTVTEKAEGGTTPAVANAVVSLWLGATKIAETTATDGTCTFTDLLPGIYNLVVTKDVRTVTSKVELTENTTCNAVLPQGATNSIVKVTEGSPDIVVGNLDTVFQQETDDTVYTRDDQATVEAGGKVEITFTAEEKQEGDTDISSDMEQIAEKKSSAVTVGLVMDYKLEKTVTLVDGTSGEPTPITQSNVLLEILLPLAADLQGKDSYSIYRVHDSEVQELKQGQANKNELDEYFTVSEDKTSLILHVKCFSTYAIGYTEHSGGGGGGPSTPTYAPTVVQPEHGAVTVSPKNPQKGSTVTITATPDDGYTVDTVTVTDAKGQAVTVTSKGDGTYTFVQPTGKVTITVTFRQIPEVSDCPRDESCPMAPFTDADRDTWYHDGVHYCVENGLMVGTGKNTFAPNATTTRGMIVTILWRLEGSPIVDDPLDYDDVQPEDWYGEAVRWADSAGVVMGYGNGKFGPNDPITREQMAAMLWRYAGSPTV